MNKTFITRLCGCYDPLKDLETHGNDCDMRKMYRLITFRPSN